MRQRVVHIRESSIVTPEQFANEPVGAAHFFIERCFPQPNGGLTARHHDVALMDVQAATECGKGSGCVLVESRDDGWVLDEELQRLVIDSGEPMGKERRLAVGDERREQFGARNLPVKHRLAPDECRQRDGDDLCWHLDLNRFAGVQARGEPRQVNAQVGEEPEALRGLLVVGLLDGKRLVLLAQLQADKVEEILQAIAIVFLGRHLQRDVATRRLNLGKRRLETADDVEMLHELLHHRVGGSALSFRSVVDDACQLNHETGAIGNG